ncbi:MAG TPA: c-type cytochrome [Chthoniobacteraceae bacterium]
MHFMPRCVPASLTVLAFLTLAAASAMAAPAPTRSEDEILKSVKVPAGFTATVFAMPPTLGYPTAVSATPDGVLFVAVDENGSLDAKPKRGRVFRCIDTDNDGKADKLDVFAEMDSPRGLIWDGSSGTGAGTLYVMYPPNLTAFTDTNGDGKSDKQEDLITGLGFDLQFRGADHTTNGIRLGIDGFIYIAVGDYGFTKAVAKDGTTLSMRGGGIVRVRPDGTGFEIVSEGQRNIYDMAISPTLDLFTRDNTNDGGGWDVRLSHVPAGAHMGYPTLFKNFPEEIIQPLAVLGGGSPTGALWLDEPGHQNGLYTVEWGRNAIMYHALTPQGAGWKSTQQDQQEWLKMNRPTDFDVDAAGRLYVASWEGATYTYNGPNAGYVLRLVKTDLKNPAISDFKKYTDAQLVQGHSSPSGVIRQAAQRELLRRGAKPGVTDGLQKIASAQGNLPSRIAALETLRQIGGAGAIPAITQLMADAALKESVVRTLGNDARLAKSIPTATLAATLADANPRVRAATITALRRLGKADAAAAILPLVADADAVISHLAIGALREMKAHQVCLAALNSSETKIQAGALRALHGIYDPVVVDGLIARLPNAQGELRRGVLNALCRLANQDAPYLSPKEWWNTRPDTSGPVYKPTRWAASEKIETLLRKEVDAAKVEDAAWLVQRMYLTKVNVPGLTELMLSKAGSDSASKIKAVEGMFRPDDSLPGGAIATLQAIAIDEKETPDFRAKALRLIQKASQSSFDAAIAAFAPLAGQVIGQPALSAVFEDFTRDGKNAKNIGTLARFAQENDPGKRALAQTILVNLATSSLVKGKEKENAEQAVQAAWAKPETAASLLGVIARTKSQSMADQVRAHLKDPNNTVAEAALYAYQSLGLKDGAAPVQQIGGMKYEEVLAAVSKGGDAVKGQEVYLRAGCIACHTTTADEPPKGPMLALAAKIYDRPAMTESILKPNAKLAQGFESAWFKTKKGEQIEGFVTREGGDSVDVRNIVGQTVTVEKGDIAERGAREQSMMPEGLMAGFTPQELASLLAYLESLKGK